MMSLTKSSNGFTMLELIVVMAILATASVALYPSFANISTKRSFAQNIRSFELELSNARQNAFTQNVTTRVTTSGSGNNYTINSFVSNSATASCITSGTWTALSTKTVSMNSNYTVTGSGIGSVCFYRDGTSSGGTFNFSKNDSTKDIGSAIINIFISTGFIDVTMQ